jgi:hypothetical protein
VNSGGLLYKVLTVWFGIKQVWARGNECEIYCPGSDCSLQQLSFVVILTWYGYLAFPFLDSRLILKDKYPNSWLTALIGSCVSKTTRDFNLSSISYVSVTIPIMKTQLEVKKKSGWPIRSLSGRPWSSGWLVLAESRMFLRTCHFCS